MCLESATLTTIQYARLHDLSVDHVAEPLPKSHIEALQKTTIPEGPNDDIDLPRIDLPVYLSTQETLALDKKGAELLRDAKNSLTTHDELENIIFQLLDECHTKKLRLETPLLLTDHEADFRSFARWEHSHFKDGCLPWEPLNNEMDVGLEWPTRLKELPATIIKELKSEKIVMQKDALLYLQATVKGSWTAEDEATLWEITTSYKKNTTLVPVTPPLLPLSPQSMPYIPSSPACHLPLLSDPVSLIDEDLRNAEQAIFEEDILIRPAQHSPFTNSSDTISSHTYIKPSGTIIQADFPESEEQFPIQQHVKVEDRKVEVPLMPATPVPSLPKTVTFNDVVEEMLLDRLPMADLSESQTLGLDEDCIFFRQAFGDAADAASRNIEQEQLQYADANNRVQVPIMDFSLPDPPWKFIQPKDSSINVMEAQTGMLPDILEKNGRLPVWPGANKLNLKLRWSVFPSELATASIEESFGDDEVLRNIFDSEANQQVVDSSKLTWKPPGFRILTGHADDDEDDLELGSFDTERDQDVTSLVRKRKMRYEEEGSVFHTSADALHKAVQEGDPKNAATTEHEVGDDVIQGREARDKSGSRLHRADNPLLSGSFSASSAIDNFLEIRASKKQKPTQSAYFAGPSLESQNKKVATERSPAEPALPAQEQIIQQPLPVPPSNPPLLPTSYIISSAILKRRQLIRIIKTLIPAATLVERDFTAHNRTAWMPNSVYRSPIPSCLDSEADFIVSPSTGIILSTLQKIKQKPLPGQKTKSAFKERIGRVSARYERLVVLVSEASADESSNGLAESDTLALAEAAGFCSSLDGSVIMQFIGGGEETLAKWLVATMVQYGSQGEPATPLLEVETMWELFLRRAGMNAYAAQVVIAELKAPDGVDMKGESKAGLFGVTAFVEMEQEERVARFERLLGGRRVLQRVGNVLDANWS